MSSSDTLLALFALCIFAGCSSSTAPQAGSVAPQVSEGGMSGGGGEVVHDAHNPWFLANTGSVTYCVSFDASTFSADLVSAEHWISRAISDWRAIFVRYEAKHPQTPLKIATQGWIEVDCAQNPDVAFRLGWGSLGVDERAFLSTGSGPHRYIAAAIRTQYDPTNLKGRGFVFLASDSGSDAFVADATQVTRPWRYPGILYAELMHELGHVFGLPHLSSKLLDFSNRWVMSEYFPEMIVDQWLWSSDPSRLNDPGEGIAYFFEPPAYEVCPLSANVRAWFDAPASASSLRFEIRYANTGPSGIEAYARDSRGGLSSLGSISFGSYEVLNTSDITAYVTAAQRFFTVPALPQPPYITGPGSPSGEISGVFTNLDGRHAPILLIMKDGGLKAMVADAATGEFISLFEATPSTDSRF